VARVAAASPADTITGQPRGMRLTPSGLLLDALLHLLVVAKAHPGTPRLTEVGLEQLLLLLAAEGGGLLLQSELPLLDRISSLVLADAARRWDTAEVAQALSLGERTLRRRLEKAGASLRDIMRETRLHAALALLQQSNLCVGEVAQRCGYDSASRFTQRFREKFGLRPSDIIRARASRDKD
ncbi:helix-turn-helix transcriptional regulator, partial [Desulfocurvibacter africanus]|uniref:helix-turn-helix transcriptional regulator n=1 Tax=Desulfocurvibacter africanus TaxID=873 RepID=UPI002FD8A234